MLRVDAEKSDSEQEKIQTKKANKPLMERKRRARINKCLFEMKQMLVDDIKNGSPSHSKWEKADILEMSVAYIRQLRRRVAAHNKTQQAFSLPYFVNGFSDCVREMQNYALLQKWPADLYEYNNRLTNHLISRLQLLISKPNMKEVTSDMKFSLRYSEGRSRIHENFHGAENLRPESLSPLSSWDCINVSGVHHKNPSCSHHQQATITLPSIIQIPHHTASVRCITGTTDITDQLKKKPMTGYCGKSCQIGDSKFNSHFMDNREPVKATRGNNRLWRPF